MPLPPSLLVMMSTLIIIGNCDDQLLCSTCGGIVVDTDCGGDDAMAISLLLRAEAMGQTSSSGRVIGITTVTGNTGAANATRNVQTLLRVLGRSEIPIYRGSEDGLAAYIEPTWFYGYDGLGDFLPPVTPTPLVPSDIHPGLYLASLVHQYPGKITILCIGPLTNLAMAVHFNDNFFNEVKHIVILGGDYKGGGNISPGIEANMYSDPDAASYFFSKIPPTAANNVTLLPLEPIANIRFPMSFRLEVLGKIKSNVIDFLNKAERLTFPKYGETWPCYDPTAASTLLDDTLITNNTSGWVEVTNQGPRGAMFASINGRTPNVKIATSLDQDKLSHILQLYLAPEMSSSTDVMCNFYRKTSFWAKVFTGNENIFALSQNC